MIISGGCRCEALRYKIDAERITAPACCLNAFAPGSWTSSKALGQGCVSPTWSNSEASSFFGAFTRVEIGHIVMGSDG
jgi:hypothetical protein